MLQVLALPTAFKMDAGRISIEQLLTVGAQAVDWIGVKFTVYFISLRLTELLKTGES
jgi:hypothetical protein